MVKVIDKRRSSSRDSTRDLIEALRVPASTPHGIKVAQPGEYIEFYDSSGSAHVWDGDVIAEYDLRMDSALTQLEEARTRIADTEAGLADANSRIQAAGGDLSAQIDQINSNTAQVKAAQESLNSIDARLTATNDDLNALEMSTSDMQSAFDARIVEANQTANAAQNTASQASQAAQEAQAAAQSVQATADDARATADAAQSKALEAAGLAGSKGKVYYQSSQPAAGTAADLWIDSDDNKPYIWDNAASKWKPVTDKVATDAAASAAKAISDASKAQADATKAINDAAAAASTAQQANVAAGNAQKSADGKNVVQYGTVTPPPNPGVKAGDAYYYVGSDNRIIETWQWSGSGWLRRKIESAQLVNLDAGYITSGYLDVAKRIQAGSIFADKLTIGIGDNIVPNGGGQAVDGWSNFSFDNTGPTNNNGYAGSFYLTGYQTKTTTPFPAAPGNYRFSVDVKGENDGGKFYVQVNCYDQAGTRISGPYPVSNQNIPNGSWQTYVGNITLPAGTAKANIGIYSQHQNGTQDPAKRVWYTGFRLQEMKDGALIVNGTITGTQINAQSVGAAVGQFVQVKATNVEVTGDLAARVVNAMSTTTKNLVVTESAILQHTTLLGKTVADELNVTKRLVARNAIVDGTIDAAQINVTGTLSANIVNAMDTTTKRLIVTEDAIMNQLTVIQNIVTPELIAEKINVKQLGADLITSGALQTDPAYNRGVKITSSGINAYDTAGTLTMRLDGKDNYLVGNLSTSGDSKTGINLVHRGQVAGIEFYSPARTSNSSLIYSHGAMWYTTPDFPPDERGLSMFATDKSAVGSGDPGIMLRPAMGIGMQGRISTFGSAIKTGSYTHSGLGGDGYFSIRQNFVGSLTAGTMPCVLVSVVSANKNEMSWGIANDSSSGFDLLVKNLAPRATGTIWVKWIVFAI